MNCRNTKRVFSSRPTFLVLPLTFNLFDRLPSMHRALFLPEIFIAILSLLSRQDNARCARVCKLWSDAALDEVWREIDSILNLFRIVGLKPGLMDLVSLSRMMRKIISIL